MSRHGNSLAALVAAMILTVAGQGAPASRLRKVCLDVNALHAAPVAGVPFVDLGPVRVVRAVIPGPPPSPALLGVTDCDGDGEREVSVPWSDAGASPPAAIIFRGGCGFDLPVRVEITFSQEVGETMWTALGPPPGSGADGRTVSGRGAHTVVLGSPGGIRLVEIEGAEICIDKICFICPAGSPPGIPLGEINGDGRRDITDPIFLLEHLFLGGDGPVCRDAADVNGDEMVDITDAILLLEILFVGKELPKREVDCALGSPCEEPGGCDDRPAGLDLLESPAAEIPGDTPLPVTPTSVTLSLESHGLLLPRAGLAVREWPSLTEMEKQSEGEPGEPDIRRRQLKVVLPHDADLGTLEVMVTDMQTQVVGQFRVPPVRGQGAAGSGFSGLTDSEKTLDNPPAGDPRIFGKDAFWPAVPVELTAAGTRRVVRWAEIQFAPFQWNPITRELREITSVEVQLRWEKVETLAADILEKLSDPALEVMEQDRLGDVLLDGGFFPLWYHLQIQRSGTFDYVIVTTDELRRNSTELDNFVEHKENGGLSVAVVSVEAIEAFYTGSERADRIRSFLRDRYAEWGIRYVLLIGNPDPYDRSVGSADSIGSVPMKMAWPRGDGSEGIPTDMYYGDLDGEWDVDGDGHAAGKDDFETHSTRHEYPDDNGGVENEIYTHTWDAYGYDLDQEVRVGRIPFDDEGRVDSILDRTIRYQQADGSSSAGRDRAYLACSFLDESTDMAYLGRRLHDRILDPGGVNAVTLYQRGSGFAHDEHLEGAALIDEWKDAGCGLVLMAGHGDDERVRVGYEPDWDGVIMNTDNVSGLVAPNPHIFMASSSNASPETRGNLAHALLYDIAVSVLAPTRPTFYKVGATDFGGSDWLGDLGYRYLRKLVGGSSAGQALAEMRSTSAPDDSEYKRQNLLAFNLYGDPHGLYKH